MADLFVPEGKIAFPPLDVQKLLDLGDDPVIGERVEGVVAGETAWGDQTVCSIAFALAFLDQMRPAVGP
jgi:hypothetical protein